MCPLLVLWPLLTVFIIPDPLLIDCVRVLPSPREVGFNFFLAFGVLEFEVDPPPLTPEDTNLASLREYDLIFSFWLYLI